MGCEFVRSEYVIILLETASIAGDGLNRSSVACFNKHWNRTDYMVFIDGRNLFWPSRDDTNHQNQQ